MSFDFRPARPEDAEQCAKVYNDGWILAFGPSSGLLPPEYIQATNDARLGRLRSAIPATGGIDATGAVLVVAVYVPDNRIVGVCAMGPSREPDALPAFPLELHSLYIAAEFHGRALGHGMVREAVRVLGWTRDSGAIFVRVFEKNPRAVAFYRKIGGAVVRREITRNYGGVERDLLTIAWESVLHLRV
ncbi:hypothetical protein HDU83_005552 [Entophlyctis luteolus]|nr:hypothetical protein HDU83_005552 [Entophlyctis luteolus]KAJ3380060.1 hypothetical protein HDU84_006195 [Entophlyctis sp. JEL0112]